MTPEDRWGIGQPGVRLGEWAEASAEQVGQACDHQVVFLDGGGSTSVPCRACIAAAITDALLAEREACALAVCPDCRAGEPLVSWDAATEKWRPDPAGVRHRVDVKRGFGIVPCLAVPIRARGS